jgi:CDP-glucose 4,6-dehydratase
MVGDPNFWRGKRVLLTGHTGFKGGWLALWLQRLGAQVVGVSLESDSTPNLFDLANIGDSLISHYCDIRDAAKLQKIVHGSKPEIIFHLAAQPLVRASYTKPLATFSTNIMGTANLLDCLRGLDSVQVAVMVTTDKVYQNNEWFYPYRETDSLGGHDPYSASKASSEIVISSYYDSYFVDQGVGIGSARAGNVIGGGDWSEDRLIPDAVRAWQSGSCLEIRQPKATRPWQHVLEPLAGYLTLARKLWEDRALSGAYNFGPLPSQAASVQTVIDIALDAFGKGDVVYQTNNSEVHEAGRLSLEIAKARETLKVSPQWDLTETVNRTMAWYLAQSQSADARVLCCNEIEAYEKILNGF